MDALHPENAEQLMAAMEAMIAKDDATKALTDAELTTAVIEKVWGNMVLWSDGELLIDELVTRFELAKGIKRDGNGEIISDQSSPGTVMANEVRAECNDLTQEQRDAAFAHGMAVINGANPPQTPLD